MSKYQTWFLLVICNLFWAGNYVFGKYVVAEMSPLWITFSRWAVASVILLTIAHFHEKPDWRAVLKQWPALVVLGLLGFVGYNMVLYSALDYTSSTNAALVSALGPGMIAIFSLYMLKEKISKIQVSGIGVSLIGVLAVLTGGNLTRVFQTAYNRGDLLMLAAVLMWTLYSVMGKQLKEVPPITATAVSAFLSAIMMAPFAIVQGIDMGNISSLAIIGILYMIIFPSVGSFVFWNMSVREIGATQAGIFLNLIPVFTALISWILGEPVTASQFGGGLLVFIGVYLTTGMLERRLAAKRELENQKTSRNQNKA
ncbi:DMT family transporter [Geosporobacter ferrireducens]|uniref:Cysteine transporter n=1 Tax=Geosporobacter ferrireducens TaxID=1424294 RepID=A0A1D8GIJ5_9FIRM|nr:DMT family transporter [Geosporobacter ferrireducens]AOT70736.1 cysteine transporter [Geosporobacter ferrireducens]MTI57542.1 DMT family transporter [Geosporobacter ferrireducens]